MDTGKFNAWVTLQWTSIPSREEYNYSKSLNAMKTGISSGLMGHLPGTKCMKKNIEKSQQPKFTYWKSLLMEFSISFSFPQEVKCTIRGGEW